MKEQTVNIGMWKGTMENFFKNVIRKKLIFSNNELEISGTSMEPCLLNDDIIKIASEVNYSTGDILVFTYDNTILVHRLIKIVNQFYYCKGDNSFSCLLYTSPSPRD